MNQRRLISVDGSRAGRSTAIGLAVLACAASGFAACGFAASAEAHGGPSRDEAPQAEPWDFLQRPGWGRRAAAHPAHPLQKKILTGPPVEAEARWRDRWGWHRSHGPVTRPARMIRLTFGDGDFYFALGRYYRRVPRGYVCVSAPVGAVVPRLPENHQTIVIDGVAYHSYDGVYYKGGPAGYTVVRIARDPNPTDASVKIADMNAASTAAPFIVNVPNKNGSYTPVTLQPAGNGMYVGPQGEVYPNAPTAEQLRALYSK